MIYKNTLFDEIFKSWNRPVREVKGYEIRRAEYGYLIIVNTLGIGEEDIEIGVENKILSLKGKTNNEKIMFENSVQYSWTLENLKERVKEVRHESKNGLTLLHIHTEIEDVPAIKVTKIENKKK